MEESLEKDYALDYIPRYRSTQVCAEIHIKHLLSCMFYADSR